LAGGAKIIDKQVVDCSDPTFEAEQSLPAQTPDAESVATTSPFHSGTRDEDAFELTQQDPTKITPREHGAMLQSTSRRFMQIGAQSEDDISPTVVKALGVAEELELMSAEAGLKFNSVELVTYITELSEKFHAGAASAEEIVGIKREIESVEMITRGLLEGIKECSLHGADGNDSLFIDHVRELLRDSLESLNEYAINPNAEHIEIIVDRAERASTELASLTLYKAIRASFKELPKEIVEIEGFARLKERVDALNAELGEGYIDAEQLVPLASEFAGMMASLWKGALAGAGGWGKAKPYMRVAGLSQTDEKSIAEVVGALDSSDGHEIDISELSRHSQLLVDYVLPVSFIVGAFDGDALSQVSSIDDPLSRAIVGFSIVEGYLQSVDIPIEFKGHPEILLKLFANKGILDAATLKQVGLSNLSRKLLNVSSRIRSGDLIVEDAVGEMLVMLADASRSTAADVKAGFVGEFTAALIEVADIDAGRADAQREYLDVRKAKRLKERDQKAVRYGMAGMGYVPSVARPRNVASEAEEVAKDEAEFARLWKNFADKERSKLELSARMAIYDIKSNVGGLLNNLDEVAGFEEIVGIQEKIQKKLFEAGGDDSIETLFEVAVCARTYINGRGLAKSLKGVRGYAQTYYNAARGFGVEPSVPFRELSHLNRHSSRNDAIIARQRFEGRISSIQDSLEVADFFNGVGIFYLQLGIIVTAARVGSAAVGALGLEGGSFAALSVDATVFGLTETALSSVVMQEPPKGVGEFAGNMAHIYSTYGWLRGAGKMVEGIRGGAGLGLKLLASPEKMAASWTAKEIRSVASAYGAYPTISQALVTDAMQIAGAYAGLQGSSAMLASVGIGQMPENYGSWEDLVTLAIIHAHAKGRGPAKQTKNKPPIPEKVVELLNQGPAISGQRGPHTQFANIKTSDATIPGTVKARTPIPYAERQSKPVEMILPAGRDLIVGESFTDMIVMPSEVRNEFEMPFDRAKRTSCYFEFSRASDVQEVAEKHLEFNEKVRSKFDILIVEYPSIAHDSVMEFAAPKQGQRLHIVDANLHKTRMVVFPDSMRLEDVMSHVGQYKKNKGPMSGVINPRNEGGEEKGRARKPADVVVTNRDRSVKIRIPAGVRVHEFFSIDQPGKSSIAYGGRRIPFEEARIISGGSKREIGFIEEVRGYREILRKIWEAGGRMVGGGVKVFKKGE
jgi:hypothetical protein